MRFIEHVEYFQVFYFTHLLYVAFWTLLVFHAPEFWKWILAPGIIFMLELTYRILSSLMGKGKTSIFAGVVLPSKVGNDSKIGELIGFFFHISSIFMGFFDKMADKVSYFMRAFFSKNSKDFSV